MFHKVTLLVYALLGAVLGHWVVASFFPKDANSFTMAIYTLVGAAAAMGLYYMLRFLNFAERTYRREMVAVPQIFKAGKEEDVPRPTFTSK